ncbi:RHS repeat-associated core domain-containing protein [Flavobacterium branchiicola]|uniref:RHS repeat-associated core domain-containing protein n=1 Tax=Flavobacterium branchiicola TaxID=1114875 RepID=A0ABV9PJZ6_9FLAO
MNARLYDPMLRRFLQVDNYIQDVTNTQNYNQYGYVYNNPLLYIDPSGNATQGGGGDCVDCGWGAVIGNGIKTIADNWDNWRIKEWANKNINGDKISEWWKSKISFNNIFGRHKSSGPPPNRSSYVNLNSSNMSSGQLGLNTNSAEIKSDNFIGKSISTGLLGINTTIGGISTYMVETAQFYKMNEVWHVTKTAGTSFYWQSRWKNPGAMYHRANQIAKVKGARGLSTKLTKAGGALLVADIALSGNIKPSHVINGAMLGVSTTGVGSIVAGVWFVADFGTMGVNYLIYDEAKGLGDILDDSDFGKTITIKMYEGLY